MVPADEGLEIGLFCLSRRLVIGLSESVCPRKDVMRSFVRPRWTLRSIVTAARSPRRILSAAAVILVSAGLVVAAPSAASADPSANAWLQLRMCESSNRYSIDTGNGYYGAYQFDLGTWQSVGGTGKPSDATPAEQDYRALMLYRKRGWQPWTCAVMVGLTEDADARSGIMPPEPASFDVPYNFVNAGGSTAAGQAAAPWPGQVFAAGDVAEEVRTWQTQLNALGYNIIGSGYFGPTTEAAVRDLQSKAGLAVTGTVDPATWESAWAGRSGAPAGGSDQDVVYKPQTKEECSVGAATAPPAPATVITFGQTRLDLQCWQWQAARRGAGLSGTAYFGTVTTSVVSTVQSQNGITGELDDRGRPAIGPKTWVAVWEGLANL